MVNGKKILAVIPARGGSKRIPKKNIIDFEGKPMIAWTIQAALNSKYIDKTIVSTDDKEIAEISIKYGAEVPFLREKYADNQTPVSIATIDCFVNLQQKTKEEYDIIVQLMPNCPNRDSENIDEAIQHFVNNQIDFQISSFSYGWMNPWWAHKLGEGNIAIPVFSDDLRNRRSQDQETLYCPTGAIWIANKEKLLQSMTFYGKDYVFCPMNWYNAFDIDTFHDLDMLSKIINHKN